MCELVGQHFSAPEYLSVKLENYMKSLIESYIKSQ